MDFEDDMNLVNQEQASTQEEIVQKLCTLPMGFRFVPTDQQLVADYLRKKINHEPVPYICTVNIYKFNPQELTETYPSVGDDDWYFFTPRARKYPHSNRPDRTAGNGYWKATGANKQIYHNNVCIGSKKSLVFYEGKASNGKKIDWVMHEFVDNQPSRQQNDINDDAMLLDKCVLCPIHTNSHRFAKSKTRDFAASGSSCQIGQQETDDKSFENESQAAYKQGTIEQQEHYCLPVEQQIFSAPAENHNLGGWFNCCSESTCEVTEQIHSDNMNLEIGPESYFGLILNDAMDNLPYQNIYNLNSSMQRPGQSFPMINHHQEAFSNREINLSSLEENQNYLGGWFNCCSETTSQVAEQVHSDNMNLESLNDVMMDNLPYQELLSPSINDDINHHPEAYSDMEINQLLERLPSEEEFGQMI